MQFVWNAMESELQLQLTDFYPAATLDNILFNHDSQFANCITG